MGVYTGSGPTDPVVGNKVSVTNFGVPTSDAVQALASAWSSYTPTIGGFTLGNGTVSGAYTQVGKFVTFRAFLTFGTTTTAASAAPTFTLPVAPAAVYYGNAHHLGLEGYFIDNGTATYEALARWDSSTTVGVYVSGTNGIRVVPSTTSPFTWATNDVVGVSGTYEAA